MLFRIIQIKKTQNIQFETISQQSSKLINGSAQLDFVLVGEGIHTTQTQTTLKVGYVWMGDGLLSGTLLTSIPYPTVLQKVL